MCSSDLAKMTRGSIDRLRVSRCRPVAPAVVRRAQMRAALGDPPRDRRARRVVLAGWSLGGFIAANAAEALGPKLLGRAEVLGKIARIGEVVEAAFGAAQDIVVIQIALGAHAREMQPTTNSARTPRSYETQCTRPPVASL